MSSTAKPDWLADATGLQEVTNFHLFSPSNVGSLTSLADTSSFERGLSQFLYWKGQLLPSATKTTLFLAFLGPKGLISPNVVNVAKALRPLCDFSKLVEVYQGANTNFLAFSFEKESVVQQILDNFKYHEDSIVLSVSYSGEDSHRFRLLWLPPLFDVARVHHMLGSISLNHCLKRESLHLGDSKYSPTNIVSGTLTLQPGTTVQQLPYLLKLPSPHKGCALLHIDSRPPMCLKCRTIGHTRKKCLMTRCTACTKVHFPQSACGASSYASVATKGILNCKDDDWMGHLADVPDSHSDIIIGSPSHASSSIINVHDPGTSSVISQPFTPSAVVSSPDISPLTSVETDKCGRTFRVSTELSNGTTLSTVDCSISMDMPHASQDSSTLPVLLPSPQPTSEPFSSSIITDSATLTSDNAHFSPPSMRKRHILLDSRHSLRSELLHYSPYYAKPLKAKITDDFSTSHSSSLDPSVDNLPFNSVGLLEVEQEELSDVSVDLNFEEIMDTSLSDIPSACIASHPSYLETPISDLEDDVPLASLSKITSLHRPILAETEPLISDSNLSTLTDLEVSQAEQLVLSHHDFLRIKMACPKQELSVANMKKLKLLTSHSISLLNIPDQPQFFNINHTSLAARIKLLHKNSLTCQSVLDLMQPSSFYERIQGHIPPSRPLLPHVNPFATSESPT